MRLCLNVLTVALALGIYANVALAQEIGDYSDQPVTLRENGVGVVSKGEAAIYSSDEVATAFNGIVIRARSEAPEPSVWVRFATEDGLGPWHELTLLRDPANPVFLAAYHGETLIVGGRFDIAILGSRNTDNIGLLAAGVFDTALDDDRESVEWDSQLSKKASISGKIVPPKIHTRSEWGAKGFIGTPVALARPDYDKLTFHHAACCGAETLEEGLAQVRAIQVFHQEGRGWSDIGYHFLIDQAGRIYQGRPFLDESIKFEDGPPLAQGAHVGGFNTGNIGVSALGCYHPPEGGSCRDELSPAAQDSLVTLFAYLSETYGPPPSILRGHRDYSSTACPGDNNYVLIPTMRQTIAALLESGNAPVGTASLTAVVGEDGVVALDWQFLTDLGITSFQVERVSASGRTVLFTDVEVVDMTLTDTDVGETGSVRYVLSATNSEGRSQELASARVDVVAPTDFTLSNNFPNPFSDYTTIRYFLAQEGVVTLRVYDISGRLVRELENSFQEAGRWYSRRLDGDRLSAGTYLYRMTVEGFSSVVFAESGTLTFAR